MHMVVGFILASLLRKKKPWATTLPSINGILEVVHTLPGRMRLYSPLLENLNNATVNKIGAEMEKIDGIQLIRLNPRGGSLLIHFDANRIQAVMVHGIVAKLLGVASELDKVPRGLLTREVNLIGRSVNHQIYRSSHGVMDLPSTLMLSILMLALYRIIWQKDRSLPNGANLLWWAYILARSDGQ